MAPADTSVGPNTVVLPLILICYFSKYAQSMAISLHRIKFLYNESGRRMNRNNKNLYIFFEREWGFKKKVYKFWLLELEFYVHFRNTRSEFYTRKCVWIGTVQKKKTLIPLKKKVYKFWSYAHSTSRFVHRIQFYTRKWGWIGHAFKFYYPYWWYNLFTFQAIKALLFPRYDVSSICCRTIKNSMKIQNTAWKCVFNRWKYINCTPISSPSPCIEFNSYTTEVDVEWA